MKKLIEVIQDAPRFSYVVFNGWEEFEELKRLSDEQGKDLFFMKVDDYVNFENTANIHFVKTPAVEAMGVTSKPWGRSFASPAPYYSDWMK